MDGIDTHLNLVRKTGGQACRGSKLQSATDSEDLLSFSLGRGYFIQSELVLRLLLESEEPLYGETPHEKRFNFLGAADDDSDLLATAAHGLFSQQCSRTPRWDKSRAARVTVRKPLPTSRNCSLST